MKVQQYCNTVLPQLNSETLYAAYDITNIAAQKTLFKLFVRL